MAKRDHGLDTRIVSIDPVPRAGCDDLCDDVHRCGLEACDLSLFDDLTEGDVIFYDGSHRLLQNSDITVLYLDVFPKLPRGVLIHQHDIFWPEDYPAAWSTRLYSEQYALAILLLFRTPQLRVVMANADVSRVLSPGSFFPTVCRRLKELERPPLFAGCSFWFEW